MTQPIKPSPELKPKTIDDVARLAGVSIKTVSRVVNNEPNVSDKTRTKVQAAIDELNYSPNASARSLAAKRSYLIALLNDNPSANYIIDVQNGVLAECASARYNVLIYPSDSIAETGGVQDVINNLVKTRVDGVIVTSPLSENTELLDGLEAHQIPFSLMGHVQGPNAGQSVYCDDQQAAQELTDYLITRGHNKIAIIRGPDNHSSSSQRLAGFQHSLHQHGITIPDHYYEKGAYTWETGREAAARLLSGEQPPTAIFAGNDDMAAGVYAAAYEKKVNIPEDLSVIGFDNNPLARQLYPRLTTVEQPIRDMARYSAKKLLAQLQSRDIDERQVFPCVLREQQSVAAL